MNENEAIQQHLKGLNYCSMLEEEGIITLEDLNDLIPGFFHLNNGETLQLDFLSPNGLELLQTSMEEIESLGVDFIKRITDFKSQLFFLQNMPAFFKKGEKRKTIGALQRIRWTEKDPFQLFFTTTKIYRDEKSLISYTQPINEIEDDSYLKEIVDFRFNFFNANYHHFQALTKREKEILTLIADGVSTKEISEQLFISEKTTSTHRQNIIKKLGTRKLSDLIKYAIAFGLIKY